ncbi:MAG: RDD family protein, partial [Bacteroidota bacterium]|nr:RDD family protein [Bacteroidota bacterium]
NGQTVGKKLLGIRIITLEGGQATVSQYLLRWLFRTVDFPLWIFFAIFTGALPWYCSVLTFSGIACVIMSDKSQRIGDIVAGTIVIFTRSKTSWQDTVFTEVEDGYKPRYPEVMKLSDKDLNSLKGFIETVKKKNNYDISFRIAERIKWKLGIQSDQDPLEFLETLLKDYNYYTAA